MVEGATQDFPKNECSVSSSNNKRDVGEILGNEGEKFRHEALALAALWLAAEPPKCQENLAHLADGSCHKNQQSQSLSGVVAISMKSLNVFLLLGRSRFRRRNEPTEVGG
jgi:hypothetical protein